MFLKPTKNRLFKTFFILGIVLFAINNTSIAAIKENKELSLYETLLPVTNFNKEEKTKAMREGFKNVIVQVSGSEKTLNNLAIQKALNSAEDYVSMFFIQEDADNNRFVHIKYDSMQINALLQQTNHPILAKRPSTSVWIMLSRENNPPHWLGEESEPELFQQLQSLAKNRKVPLLFPLFDLTEAELVSDESVLQGELSPLEAAAERYNAEMVWFGKLTQQKSGWYGQWTLLSYGEVEQWDASHADLETLCKEALDEMTKRSASINMNESDMFASTQRNSHADHQTIAHTEVHINGHENLDAKTNTLLKLKISVSGIKGIAEYSKVLEYLKTLPTVKEVEVAQVSPEQTLFELSSTGNREGVVESLEKGKMLVAEKITPRLEVPPENTENPDMFERDVHKVANNNNLKDGISLDPVVSQEISEEQVISQSKNISNEISHDKDILTYRIAEVF